MGLAERTRERMTALGIPTGTDRPRRASDLPCKCGHAWRFHDPEDAECDSAAMVGFGKCPCVCFRSPDPNLTTLEYLFGADAP